MDVVDLVQMCKTNHHFHNVARKILHQNLAEFYYVKTPRGYALPKTPKNITTTQTDVLIKVEEIGPSITKLYLDFQTEETLSNILPIVQKEAKNIKTLHILCAFGRLLKTRIDTPFINVEEVDFRGIAGLQTESLSIMSSNVGDLIAIYPNLLHCELQIPGMRIQADIVDRLLRLNPQLRSLTLGVITQAVFNILHLHPNLTELTYEQLSTNEIVEFPNMQKLTLFSSYCLPVLVTFPQLKEFHLHYETETNFLNFMQFINKHSTIERVGFHGKGFLNDADFETIDHVSSLKETSFELHKTWPPSDKSVTDFVQRNNQMESFEFIHGGIVWETNQIQTEWRVIETEDRTIFKNRNN